MLATSNKSESPLVTRLDGVCARLNEALRGKSEVVELVLACLLRAGTCCWKIVRV